MTIEQYVKEKNISYRELARRLGISRQTLLDLKNRKYSGLMKEKVGNKFLEVAPEIDIVKEVKIFYRIKGE